MNYKAQLRGFAFDRAKDIAKNNNEIVTLEQLKKASEEIVEYLYIPEKDIESHLETLMPLICKAGDLERLDTLILQLQQIKAEMEAGIIKPEAN